MDWLNDKKNQPIVAGILAVIILGAGIFVYFKMFAGSGGESAPVSDGSEMVAPMEPPPTDTAAPAQPTAATTAAPAQAAGSAEVASVPMERWRKDPFLPQGYKPPPRGPRYRPKPHIWDLPFPKYPTQLKQIDPGLIPDEPQPVRRMAGLILGDTVFAIIETSGASEIVRPGDLLKDGKATVERIETDKVVLKTRDRTPKFLVVRMASAVRNSGGAVPSGNMRGPGGSGYSRGDEPPPPM